MILRGISFIPTHRSTDIAILAKRAEGLGFDSIWVPEQHTLPVKVEKPVPRLWGDIVDPLSPRQGVGGHHYTKTRYRRRRSACPQPHHAC